MNIQKVIGLAAFLLIALNMFAHTDAYTNRQSWAKKTFQLGTRFGRAGGGGGKKLAALRTMVALPRNERFELGTRYGKRSNLGEIAETLIYPVAAAAAPTLLCGKDDELLCTHTGVSNIYRCNQSYEDDGKEEPHGEELKD